MEEKNGFMIEDGELSECILDSDIKRVRVPRGVTSIGTGAFGSFYDLEKVIISSGVEEIGSGAFDSCISLREITLPKSLTRISSKAFLGCTSLKSISVPCKAASISFDAFENTVLNTYGAGAYMPSAENPFAILVHTIKGAQECEIHPDTEIICENAATYWGASPLKRIAVPRQFWQNDWQWWKGRFPLDMMYDIAAFDMNGDESYPLVKYTCENFCERFREIMDDKERLSSLLSKLKISLRMIDKCMDLIPKPENANVLERTNLVATLLNYKHEHYTAEQIREYEDSKTGL